MLNRSIIMGRITHPLEIKMTPSGVPVLQFTVAVDRNYADKNTGERQADFISCVAWRQAAEFIGRYFDKGRMIALEGRLQSRTYDDKNGVKHYITELIVDQASFTGEPKQQGGNYQGGFNQQQNGGYNQHGSYQGSYNQQQSSGYNQQYNNGYNQQQGGGYNQQSGTLGDLSEFEDVLSDEGVPF